MREIKFRGKSLQTGEWVYGYYMYDKLLKGPRIYAQSECEMGWWESYKFDPVTLGQYTGLKDKNGVEIYEGDWLNTDNISCRLWHVSFQESCFVLCQSNADYFCSLHSFMKYNTGEVIGSTHDNPELLEVSE